jgi:hypothetical protein
MSEPSPEARSSTSSLLPYPVRSCRRFFNVIPLSIYLYMEMIAAAVLALWVVTRWPQLGPKSIVAALGALLVALVLGSFASTAVTAAITLPYGIYAALLGCILPTFFLIFLAGAWLLRSLVDAIGGGSGGTGHSVKA